MSRTSTFGSLTRAARRVVLTGSAGRDRAASSSFSLLITVPSELVAMAFLRERVVSCTPASVPLGEPARAGAAITHTCGRPGQKAHARPASLAGDDLQSGRDCGGRR